MTNITDTRNNLMRLFYSTCQNQIDINDELVERLLTPDDETRKNIEKLILKDRSFKDCIKRETCLETFIKKLGSDMKSKDNEMRLLTPLPKLTIYQNISIYMVQNFKYSFWSNTRTIPKAKSGVNQLSLDRLDSNLTHYQNFKNGTLRVICLSEQHLFPLHIKSLEDKLLFLTNLTQLITLTPTTYPILNDFTNNELYFIKDQWIHQANRVNDGNVRVGPNCGDMVEWYKANRHCTITGIKLEFKRKSNWTASVDRRVSYISYDFNRERNNLQPTCAFINTYLKSFTQELKDELHSIWRQFTIKMYRTDSIYRKVINYLEDKNKNILNFKAKKSLLNLLIYYQSNLFNEQHIQIQNTMLEEATTEYYH